MKAVAYKDYTIEKEGRAPETERIYFMSGWLCWRGIERSTWSEDDQVLIDIQHWELIGELPTGDVIVSPNRKPCFADFDPDNQTDNAGPN